jgi:multiple sugar transport system substrate-binding protein
VTLSVLAAGCDRGRASDGRTEVVFWHSFVSSTIPAFNELIARFEEEHPDIRINAQYVPTGEALIQKLITAVRSNTAPDMSWMRADYFEPLVSADAIYPMEQFVHGPDGLAQEDLDDIYPALLEYSSFRGTLYALPMEATNLALLYNKDLFREAGLDPERPPQTWDELADYSRRLVVEGRRGRNERIGFIVPISPATGPQGGWMTWQWMPFLWQAGGYLIDLEQRRVLFGEEPAVRALGFWKELYDAQNLRSFTTEHQSAFVSRQAAMMLDGPWNLPNYDRMLRGMDWGIAPLPTGPEKQATVVGGEYLSIFRQSDHPEAAWTFIKWMTRADVQAFWAMRSGYLPIRASVLDVPEFQAYLEEHPAFRVYVEQMEVAQAQRPMDYFPLEIQRELATALERATVGGEDPRQALERAASRSNALLDRADRASPTPDPVAAH